MISDKIMINIYGGAISGSLLNSLARIISAFLEVGRSIGSAIRMFRNKNYRC